MKACRDKEAFQVKSKTFALQQRNDTSIFNHWATCVLVQNKNLILGLD